MGWPLDVYPVSQSPIPLPITPFHSGILVRRTSIDSELLGRASFGIYT
jgi:hypothetical protein